MVTKEKMAVKLFLRAKPVKMLASLRHGPKYATVLSKECDCTYSHTVKLLDMFKELGLVDFEKKGRIKVIKLTNLGEDLSSTVENILTKLGRIKDRV